MIKLTLLFLIIQTQALFAKKFPASFVDIGYGARPLGLSGAFTAISDDATAIMWNPAGLLQLEHKEINFMYTKQKDLIPYNLLAYAHPLKGKTIGIGFITSGDDALKENIFALSYSQIFPKLPLDLGLTTKIYTATFGKNADGGDNRVRGDAFGFGLDIGSMYNISDFTAALVIHNFISPILWKSSVSGKYNEPLPAILVFAGKYKINNTLIAFDFEDSRNIHIGVEKEFFGILYLRAGYNKDITLRTKAEYGFGIGLSPTFKTFNFSIDFGYRFERINNSWRISTRFLW